jgi:hypothetical protein
MSRGVILFIVLVCLSVAAFVGFRIYNMPHRDVAAEQGIRVSATALFQAYTQNEQQANQQYLDKAIEVTGQVKEVVKDSGMSVILNTGDEMFGVRCSLKDTAAAVAEGQNVTIKGICSGYLDDVVLTDAILLSNR